MTDSGVYNKFNSLTVSNWVIFLNVTDNTVLHTSLKYTPHTTLCNESFKENGKSLEDHVWEMGWRNSVSMKN